MKWGQTQKVCARKNSNTAGDIWRTLHLIIINVRINRVIQQRRRIRQILGTSTVLHLLLSTFLCTKESSHWYLQSLPHYFFFALFHFVFPILFHSTLLAALSVSFLSLLLCLSTFLNYLCSSLLVTPSFVFPYPVVFFFNNLVKSSLSFLFNLCLFLYFDIVFSCIMTTLIEGGQYTDAATFKYTKSAIASFSASLNSNVLNLPFSRSKHHTQPYK